VKWVSKLKLKPDGSVAKYKARLVPKGFLQQEGIDYTEVFALVARIDTVRLVTVVASSKGWKMAQMDVKSAFLNGPLEKEVYIVQPSGFQKQGRKHLVYRLRKALYGLKQAPRAWNKLIDAVLAKLGFMKCTVELGVYVKNMSHTNTLIVCLYVDVLIITGNKDAKFKEKMKAECEMTDLGTLNYFLGLEFVHTPYGVFLHQKKYAQEILKRFKMEECNEAIILVLPVRPVKLIKLNN